MQNTIIHVVLKVFFLFVCSALHKRNLQLDQYRRTGNPIRKIFYIHDIYQGKAHSMFQVIRNKKCPYWIQPRLHSIAYLHYQAYLCRIGKKVSYKLLTLLMNCSIFCIQFSQAGFKIPIVGLKIHWSAISEMNMTQFVVW